MLRFNATYQGEGEYTKIGKNPTPAYEVDIILPKEFALYKVKLNLIIDLHFSGLASCTHTGVMYKEDGNYGIFQIFDQNGEPKSWYAIEKNNS